jgi:TRAP-type C4-dicarboxylate transport system permease small subunit
VQELLKKADDGLHQAERVLVVAALLVMSVLVFLSVAHSRWSDTESILTAVIARLLGSGPDDGLYQSLQTQSFWIAVTSFFVLVVAAARTASTRSLWPASDAPTARTTAESSPRSWPLSLGIGAGVTAGSLGVMFVLFGQPELDPSTCSESGFSLRCGVYPNGIVWAEAVALILTIWVAFVGAAMAAKDNRHLKVEAVVSRLPAGAKRWVGLISGLVTAGFCLFLAFLSFKYVAYQYEIAVGSQGIGGNFEGTEIKVWLGFSIVPVAYALTALRSIATGVRSAMGLVDDTPAELADVDLSAIEGLDELHDHQDTQHAAKSAAKPTQGGES